MTNMTAPARVTAAASEIRLDVRPLPPRARHAAIFATWNRLSDDESMVVVNDHDPLPLYYQFACEHRGAFRWEYLEAGPDAWQVRLTKGPFPDPGFHPQSRMATPPVSLAAEDGQVTLDVRPIFERGETPCDAIDAAAARVEPGQKLVLLVPFEPVPLYHKLARQGFQATPQAQADGSWRIEFSR